tara:strand:+ start:3014 stop:3664 length:651 start_codon:yes stop_codon:yes gene_type:complete
MSIPNFARAYKYVIQKLEEGLSPTLFYHNIHHTKNQVLRDTEVLAETEGVSAEEMVLLRTGALYHDLGFIKQYWDNEPLGVSIAEETLPTFGYTVGQIEIVRGLILATRIPQSPKNSLEQILCDADMYNLGGEETFWMAGDCLLRELLSHYKVIPMEFHPPYSIQEWWERQCRFLETHSYFTSAAQILREEGKQRNLKSMRQLLHMFYQKNRQLSE